MGSSPALTASSQMRSSTVAQQEILDVDLLDLQHPIITGMLPTVHQALTPYVWGSRCSASELSATGQKATVGEPPSSSLSLLEALGRTGSTWVTGRKALESCSALGDLGFGPWLMLFSWQLAILALPMGPFIFRHLCQKSHPAR